MIDMKKIEGQLSFLSKLNPNFTQDNPITFLNNLLAAYEINKETDFEKFYNEQLNSVAENGVENIVKEFVLNKEQIRDNLDKHVSEIFFEEFLDDIVESEEFSETLLNNETIANNVGYLSNNLDRLKLKDALLEDDQLFQELTNQIEKEYPDYPIYVAYAHLAKMKKEDISKYEETLDYSAQKYIDGHGDKILSEIKNLIKVESLSSEGNILLVETPFESHKICDHLTSEQQYQEFITIVFHGAHDYISEEYAEELDKVVVDTVEKEIKKENNYKQSYSGMKP